MFNLMQSGLSMQAANLLAGVWGDLKNKAPTPGIQNWSPVTRDVVDWRDYADMLHYVAQAYPDHEKMGQRFEEWITQSFSLCAEAKRHD